MREEVERIGMTKYGVEFVSPDHDHQATIEFAEAWDKSMPYAWQVRRSELDELLFRNAAGKGARALEGCRVRKVEFDADGATVEAELDDGAQADAGATRFVVDATGRDTLLANQFRCKQKNPKHNSSALYGHFRGARRLEGRLEGNITIFWFDHGWFWHIPLADGITSIGAVCWPYYLKSRTKPLPEFFHDTIALCPALAERLAGAELVSTRSTPPATTPTAAASASGERYLLLGDAYAFIDPVFSSGVYLAMHSAFDGAEVVETTLDPAAPGGGRAAPLRPRTCGTGRASSRGSSSASPTRRCASSSWRRRTRCACKEALISLLAGDIFGKTPIWRLDLRSSRRCTTWCRSAISGAACAFWKRRRFNIRDAEVPAS